MFHFPRHNQMYKMFKMNQKILGFLNVMLLNTRRVRKVEIQRS